MKIHKRIFALCSVCVLAVSSIGMQVSAVAITPSISAVKNEDIGYESVQPRKDKIDWVYKSENGYLYRRLFNFSKNEWIGDWIIC